MKNLFSSLKNKVQARKLFSPWFFVCLLGFGVYGTSFLFSNVESATPPSIVTYQGKLLESGASVTTTKSMAFVIYDASSGGTAVYTAAGTLPTTSTISVTPSQGIFSVDLGGSGTNALDSTIFQDNDELYLEVSISGTTLSPRKRITASPYAINSTYLNGVAATSTAQTSTYIPISAADGSFDFNTTTISMLFGTNGYFTGTTTLLDGGAIFVNDIAETVALSLGSVTDGERSGSLVLNGNSVNSALFGLAGVGPLLDASLDIEMSVEIASGLSSVRVGGGAASTYGLVRLDNELGNSMFYFSATSSESSYINTGLSIGSTTTGTIANTNFVFNGNDLFVGGQLGVESGIFTDSVLDVAGTGTSTFAGSINLASGKCFAVDGTCITGGSSQWTTSGSDIYYTTGRVAVGTSTFGYGFTNVGDSYFSGTSTFAADNIHVAGYRLGIGSLAGSSNLTFGTGLGSASLSGNYNASFGNALSSNTSGSFNIAMGYGALDSNTIGSSNVAIGANTLNLNVSGNYNVAIGGQALLSNTTGSNNSTLGYQSLNANVIGTDNSAFGSGALKTSTSSYNSAFGSNALLVNTSGDTNSAFGYQSLFNNTQGSANTAVGGYSLDANTTGSNNVGLGYSSLGDLVSGQFNVAIGNSTGYGLISGNYNTILGSQVTGLTSTLSNNIIIADGQGNQRIRVLDTGYVGVNTTTPEYELTVSGTLFSTDAIFDTNITVDGLLLGTGTGGGSSNIVLGSGISFGDMSGSSNIAIGSPGLGAAGTLSGSYNIGIGSSVLSAGTSAQHNVGMGYGALSVTTIGIANVAIGSNAMASNVNGHYNVAIGVSVLNDNISGQYNTVFGYNSGDGITTGDYNTIFGAQVTGLSSNLSNNIIIADGQGNQRIRVLDTGLVGINTTTPGYGLTVSGTTYISATTTLASALSVLGGNINASYFMGGALFEVGTTSTPGVVGIQGVGSGIFVYDDTDPTNSYIEIGGDGSEANFHAGGNGYYGMLKLDDEGGIEKVNITGSSTLDSYIMGNIGIGTNVPSSTLHVFGNTTTLSNIETGAFGPVIDFFQDSASPAQFDQMGGMHFYGNDSNGNKTFYGGVGGLIVTSTDGAEQGVIGFKALAPNDTYGIVAVTADSSFGSTFVNLIFGDTFGSGRVNGVIETGSGTNGNIAIMPDGTGKVGIGTTTPSYLLHVARETDGVVAAFTDSEATCTVDPSDGDYSCTSDRNLKTNIVPLSSTIDRIMQLIPSEYNWISDPNGKINYGFIAQDVESIFPSLVNETANGYKSLSQIGLIPFLTKAIQEQQVQITALAGRLNQGGDADTLDASFEGTLRVKKQVAFGEDTVGQVKLLLGANTVRVSFVNKYEHQPIVTISPMQFVIGQYRVTEVNEDGFSVELSEPQLEDITFSWHAFAGNGAIMTVSDGSKQDINLVVVQEPIVENYGSGGGDNGSEEGGDYDGESVADESIIDEGDEGENDVAEPQGDVVVEEEPQIDLEPLVVDDAPPDSTPSDDQTPPVDLSVVE